MQIYCNQGFFLLFILWSVFRISNFTEYSLSCSPVVCDEFSILQQSNKKYDTCLLNGAEYVHSVKRDVSRHKSLPEVN